MSPRSLSAVGITGGCGALGKHLIAKLIAAGVPRIIVFDRATNTQKSENSIEHVEGDILIPSQIENAFKECDTVFHLAALIHARRSAHESEYYHKINVVGTECVVNACIHANVKRLIFASTSHVYGIPEQSLLTEMHPTRPLSVYAQSKLDGEQVIQKNVHHFVEGALIARMTNIYGGTTGEETVIGRALMQAATGQDIQLRNLSEIRDFIHVDDAAEGLIRLARVSSIKTGEEIINIGSGKGVLLHDLAQLIAQIAGTKVLPAEDNKPSNIPKVILDINRLISLTGWQPSITLKEGLQKALQLYLIGT